MRGLAAQLVRWLERRGDAAVIPAEMAELVGLGGWGRSWDDPELTDFTIGVVLGGDGTLLRAAKQLLEADRPLLGVNLGHLGFLTEVEVPDLYPALSAFLSGDYDLDERYMLSARILREGRELARYHALNDVVVTKGPFARLVNLETFVGPHYVATYPADGLIVSTPTGSTAYSLSAGGPILSPDLSIMVMTPICPHSFFDRSIVIDGRQRITIRVHAPHRETFVTVDGQEGLPIEDGDEVAVEACERKVKLLRRPGWSFFNVLRGWRTRR